MDYLLRFKDIVSNHVHRQGKIANSESGNIRLTVCKEPVADVLKRWRTSQITYSRHGVFLKIFFGKVFHNFFALQSTRLAAARSLVVSEDGAERGWVG